MRNRVIFVSALVGVLVGCTGAFAQEKRQTGLLMGYPVSFGLIFQASDRVALRPEVSVSAGTAESTSSLAINPAATSSSWGIGAAFSVNFYTQSRDKLRTYVSPRFSYTRGRTTNDLSNSESTNWSYGLSASFGAEYALNDRMSLFAEVGYGFTGARTSFTLMTTSQENRALTWGHRSAIGAILYF